MKKSFVILITTSLLFWSCASQQQKADPCLERQAVVEYGTSRVKMLIAEKNVCEKQDIKILAKTEWEVETNVNQSQLPSGMVTLQPSVVENLKKISQSISRVFKKFQTQTVFGLATGIYRSVENRELVFNDLEKIIIGKIKVLSPDEEAQMGLMSIIVTEKPAGNFIVWDFGGNTMQFAIVDGEKTVYITGLPGSNILRAEVMSKLKKKKTPNPIGLKNIPGLEKYMKAKFESSLKPLAPYKAFEVYGIGGVHSKSVATAIKHLLNDPNASKTYSHDQVAKLLKHLAQSNDLQIGGKFPDHQASNVLAVHAIMKQMGWNAIKVSEQTLALGYLLNQTAESK
jgi:exopolyphosphatase/guanosine-5'-triphosphate,3'-diphosphate pyrophosphatase